MQKPLPLERDPVGYMIGSAICLVGAVAHTLIWWKMYSTVGMKALIPECGSATLAASFVLAALAMRAYAAVDEAGIRRYDRLSLYVFVTGISLLIGGFVQKLIFP